MRPVARTLLWTSIIGASFIVIYLRGMVAADAWHWVGAKSEVAIVLHEGEIWVRYNHVAPRPNTPLFRFIPAWMMATGRITDESRLPKKGIHHYSSRQIRMEFLQFYPIRSQFLVSWTSDPDILRMTGCRTIVAPIWLAWLVPLTYYLLHRLLALVLGHRRRLRAFRATITGKCLHCDFDLRASAYRCPECGMPIPTTLTV